MKLHDSGDSGEEYEINALEILAADPDVLEMASLEKLRMMASYAQRKRNLTEGQLARQLGLESGKRTTTLGAVLDVHEKIKAIEIDVVSNDRKRPKFVLCQLCGKDIEVQSSGMVPKSCYSQLGGCKRQTECAGGCGAKPLKGSFFPSALKARRGADWRCMKCAAIAAAPTPEDRSELSKKSWAGRTSEQRRKQAMRAAQRLTREQRSEAARKREASKTQTQRSERARKGNATRKARKARKEAAQ